MPWMPKANLRGPAGYNSTDAAGDAAALAAFLAETVGPNAFSTEFKKQVSASVATVAPTKPSGVTAAAEWDAVHKVYRPKAFAGKAGKFAAAAAGTKLFKILCVGDSLTAGEGITSAQTLSAYPAILRDTLAGAGYALAGEGWIQPHSYLQSAAAKPPQWSMTGAWIPVAGAEYRSNALGTTTANNTITFTSTLPGDTLEFAYLQNSGTFFYSVDGGAEVQVTFNAGPVSYAIKTVTGLNPASTHTVTIRTGSTNVVHIGPARVYKSAGGLLVANAGIGGSPTAAWLSTATSYWAGPSALILNADVDLVLIEPMIYNDMNSGASTATHKANVKSIIQSFQGLASKPGVLIVVPGYSSQKTDAAYNAYRKLSYEIADELALPLVDIAEAFGPQAGSTAYYAADGLHLNNAGYAAMGKTVAAALID